MIALQPGLPLKAFDVATAEVSNSNTYALPGVATLVEWQTFFGTNPDAVTILIQTSIDGVTFTTQATTTTVTGAEGNFVSSAQFVRARISAITNGVGVTAILLAKKVTYEIDTLNEPAGSIHNVQLNGGSDDFSAVSGNGTTGQVLTSNGASDAPTWEDSGGGSGPSGAEFDVQLNDGADAFSAVTNGTDGQVLTANTGAAPTWETPGGGGTPAGSDLQVQYNDDGDFGAVNWLSLIIATQELLVGTQADHSARLFTFDSARLTLGYDDDAHVAILHSYVDGVILFMNAGGDDNIDLRIPTNGRASLKLGSANGCQFKVDIDNPGKVDVSSFDGKDLQFGFSQSEIIGPTDVQVQVLVNDDDAFLKVIGEHTITITAPGTGAPSISLPDGTVRAAFKSADDSAGVTAGPFTAITGITVKDGIVTALTGS